MSTEKTYDVIAVGNAIVDVIAKIDETFIQEQGLTKGVMTLIDVETMQKLMQGVSNDVLYQSGGSVANTVAGIASFGGACAYIGKTANDLAGQKFRDDMKCIGVDFDTAQDDEIGLPTAHCISLVTPDAERTMATYLGVSTELAPDDLDTRKIRLAKVTYLEGYLFNKSIAKEAFQSAAIIAHMAGNEVAISLSDPFCVHAHRDDFLRLIHGHVDIVFANEQELLALYQTEDFDAALAQLAENVAVCAVTRGANGATIIKDGQQFDVPAMRVENVVDTTGAGDLFAAGFLYGHTKGMDPYACGILGAKAAAEVIAQMGARPQRSLKELLAA